MSTYYFDPLRTRYLLCHTHVILLQTRYMVRSKVVINTKQNREEISF